MAGRPARSDNRPLHIAREGTSMQEKRFAALPLAAYAGTYSNDYVEPVHGPSAYDQRRCWWEHKQLFDQWGNPAGTQTVKTCRR